jgi:hypothetical protein
MRMENGPPRVWETQLPVDYIDTTLVINTWETVVANLSGGNRAKLWYVTVEQTNNGATNETIEFEMTINGTAYTWTINAVSGSTYYIYFTMNLATGDFEPVSSAASVRTFIVVDNTHPISFNAKSVGLMRVRQTTDVDGTSAQIEVNTVWEKLVAV